MRPVVRTLIIFPIIFLGLLLIHFSLLRLPYFWDEAGYYVPAALDFYHHGWLIPRHTLPTGHTPLVMVYLGAVWHLFGFSEVITRSAMVLIAAAIVLTTYRLGRRVAGREAGVWAAVLLALSPLFFAQSSLVFLDLTAAFFTTMAILFVLDDRWGMFAAAASLAVLSKETAVVMLAVAWAFMLFRRKERRAMAWTLAVLPVVPLIAWAIYYHGCTGFWTGNAGYLQYNLYSAVAPLHILRSLLARLAEIFFQGFEWLLVLTALAGIAWSKRKPRPSLPTASLDKTAGPDRAIAAKRAYRPGLGHDFGDFLFLAWGLIAVYVLMLSVVGGAILPRYMLPAFPVFFVMCVAYIMEMPIRARRVACVVIAACFVAAWFINPPYPFPYEDNTSYADFVHLHQRAAHYLESLPGHPVILTAWPATDELEQPFLGYVTRRLKVSAVQDFSPGSFAGAAGFDVVYLYSRQWAPPGNLLTTFRPLRAISRRFYEYRPQVQPAALALRFHLELVQEFRDRGQWVRIYRVRRQPPSAARVFRRDVDAQPPKGEL